MASRNSIISGVSVDKKHAHSKISARLPVVKTLGFGWKDDTFTINACMSSFMNVSDIRAIMADVMPCMNLHRGNLSFERGVSLKVDVNWKWTQAPAQPSAKEINSTGKCELEALIQPLVTSSITGIKLEEMLEFMPMWDSVWMISWLRWLEFNMLIMAENRTTNAHMCSMP